jgi:ribosomal protein S18 acetylase RimI-like enzyme
VTEEFVTGPHRVDSVHPELADGLAQLWGRSAVAGRAAGFGPDDSVEALRGAATELVAEVSAKRTHMLTLGRAHELVGAAALRPDPWPLRAHTAELALLLVDPELREQGWGQQLHDAVLVLARARGLTRLQAFDREGSELAQLCAANGWDERGRWPGALRRGHQDVDGVWFTREV